jgi:hypothetical protein
MRKNKKGQGRKPIDPKDRRVRFTIWVSPGFKERFKKWCKNKNISYGRAFEMFFRKNID